MLSNNLTLDEEDAVQLELRELQAVSQIYVTKDHNIDPSSLRHKNCNQKSQSRFRRHRRLSPSCLSRMVSRLLVYGAHVVSCFAALERDRIPVPAWNIYGFVFYLDLLTIKWQIIYLDGCVIRTCAHHPSKFPKPTFRFFFTSSPPPGSFPSKGLFKLRYFPTPPLVAPPPKAESPVPTFTPNQLMSSPFFSALRSCPLCSASALFASFFARRVLYSSNGSWWLQN